MASKQTREKIKHSASSFWCLAGVQFAGSFSNLFVLILNLFSTDFDQNLQKYAATVMKCNPRKVICQIILVAKKKAKAYNKP